MNGVFPYKRFLSFLFLPLLVLSLQSFAFVELSPLEETHGVIIEIDEVFFDIVELDEPVLIAGNPAVNGDWVKVIAENTISSFDIRTMSGEVLYESDINSDQFKFQLDGFQSGNYLIDLYVGGIVYSKILSVKR